MGLDLDLTPLEKAGFIAAGISLAVAIVSLIGELAGWWGDLGEIGIAGGTLLTVALAFLTLFAGSSRRQVTGVGQGVQQANHLLGGMGGTLQAIDGGLGTIEGTLTTMDTKLDKLDKLDAMDTKLDTLDVIQAHLDIQTGALREQTTVLREIRDRL